MIVPGQAGWIRADDEDAPAVPGTVYFRLIDGRVTEVYLAADVGREITAGHLRTLPLGRLRAKAQARPDLLAGPLSAPDPGIRGLLDRVFPKPRPRLKTPTTALSPPRVGLDDDFLRQVADAYRAAVLRGEQPNVTLAEQVGHERTRTVERWVYLARKRGFLPRGKRGAVG